MCLRGLRSTGGPAGSPGATCPGVGGQGPSLSPGGTDSLCVVRPLDVASTPRLGFRRERARQSGTKVDVGTVGDPGTGRLGRLGAVHDVSGLGVGGTLFPPHPLRCPLAQMVASSPFLEVVSLVTETTCLRRAPGVHGVGRVCTSIVGQGLRPREAHRGCPGRASNPVQEAGAWGWHLVGRIMWP